MTPSFAPWSHREFHPSFFFSPLPDVIAPSNSPLGAPIKVLSGSEVSPQSSVWPPFITIPALVFFYVCPRPQKNQYSTAVISLPLPFFPLGLAILRLPLFSRSTFSSPVPCSDFPQPFSLFSSMPPDEVLLLGNTYVSVTRSGPSHLSFVSDPQVLSQRYPPSSPSRPFYSLRFVFELLFFLFFSFFAFMASPSLKPCSPCVLPAPILGQLFDPNRGDEDPLASSYPYPRRSRPEGLNLLPFPRLNFAISIPPSVFDPSFSKRFF